MRKTKHNTVLPGRWVTSLHQAPKLYWLPDPVQPRTCAGVPAAGLRALNGEGMARPVQFMFYKPFPTHQHPDNSLSNPLPLPSLTIPYRTHIYDIIIILLYRDYRDVKNLWKHSENVKAFYETDVRDVQDF